MDFYIEMRGRARKGMAVVSATTASEKSGDTVGVAT